MKNNIPKIFFDRQDFELLEMVDNVHNRDKTRKDLKRLLDTSLHPHGIKEMAAFSDLRIAYAAVNLLSTLEDGAAHDRVSALRILHDEALGAGAGFNMNTARAMLQIMKELVRSQGDPRTRLELAHDFRAASSGKPGVVRDLLRRYRLLEMPEEWNQAAFDAHVHDSNTKGRKSPTHLIMDAWIKGIRFLTVIYYNYVRPEAASELIEAAEIMDIRVRIGIEFPAMFRNKKTHLIWAPRGFTDAKGFLNFLAKVSVTDLMDEGRKVSLHKQARVMDALRIFNEKHIPDINRKYGLKMDEFSTDEFLSFVSVGQASILHLEEFAVAKIFQAMSEKMSDLRAAYKNADKAEQSRIKRETDELDRTDPESVAEYYIRRPRAMNSSGNDGSGNEINPNCGNGELPFLLTLSPPELIERLNDLHSGCRLTLNLNDLSPEDVLELLYDCRGAITHLEIFNLKDFYEGQTARNAEINNLCGIINKGNFISLKRSINELIQRVETSGAPDAEDRLKKLRTILRDMGTLKSFYKAAPIKFRVGSDSAGRTTRMYGMGMVIKETLPPRARREIDRKSRFPFQYIPVEISARPRITYRQIPPVTIREKILHNLSFGLPFLKRFNQTKSMEWLLGDTRLKESGNVVILGGLREWRGNGFYINEKHAAKLDPIKPRYLNTGIKNALKVFCGFAPAFITFNLTKDWFILAWFGAFIWLGITGLRNVIQSVAGGGGIKRSSLLSWRDYVSWERVADSLLYTGFSVPLLDFLVKTKLMNGCFNINTATNPVALYTVMALVNGAYISTHNYFRSLPKEAVIGNFFRSAFSIPIAIALNAVIGHFIIMAGIADAAGILELWAAVISKFSSDCVAGFIEGYADYKKNIRVRHHDYSEKLSLLFSTYAKMELLFPERNVLEMLESPENLIDAAQNNKRGFDHIIIINALDLLYFWMYQPRARTALAYLVREMSHDERMIFAKSQSVLELQQEISRLFINGLVGRNFSRALSFYLKSSEDYLESIRNLTAREN